MVRTPAVHWHEGLFLQPHHLQMTQCRANERLVALQRLVQPFPYGLIESVLDDEELAGGRAQFRRLHAIMKDGTEVNVPHDTELPALRFDREYQENPDLMIFLAVPSWSPGRANVIDEMEGDRRQKRLYWVDEFPWLDENTAQNEQQVRVRRVNARLTLDNDDGDFEYLPILKVTQGVGSEGETPVVDTAYIPPCLHLTGSSALMNLVRDIVTHVERIRKECVAQRPWAVGAGEPMGVAKVGDFLAGLVMSRYSALLAGLLTPSAVTPPFPFYLALLQLVAELSVLYPEKGSFQAPEYNHDELGICFQDVREKIKRFTETTIAARWQAVPFGIASSDAVRVVSLAEPAPQDFTAPDEFFLGIQSAEPASTVQALATDPDRVKLMPRRKEGMAVQGVPLEYEPYPPPVLPSVRGRQYFRVMKDRKELFWQEMKADRALALIGPPEIQKWTVELYMILPEKK